MSFRILSTTYKGVKFRSRTEARWALFFDLMGASWQYEPEGFELPGGVYYLPDFLISKDGNQAYAEVKPLGDSFDKARLFAANVAPIYALEGPPDMRPYLFLGFRIGNIGDQFLLDRWSIILCGYLFDCDVLQMFLTLDEVIEKARKYYSEKYRAAVAAVRSHRWAK